MHLLDLGAAIAVQAPLLGHGAAPSLMPAFHTEYCVPGALLGTANGEVSKTLTLLSRSSFFGGNKYEEK